MEINHQNGLSQSLVLNTENYIPTTTFVKRKCRPVNELMNNAQKEINPPKKRSALLFASVNARSVRNKTVTLVDHILENKIDICVITETWVKDIDSVRIAELSPLGYRFRHFARQSERRGGGTGVLHNELVKVSFVDGDEKRSFEFSEWNCSIGKDIVKLIVVYRPPYSPEHPVTSGVFYDEFSAFLDNLVMCPEVLIIAGDFNFQWGETDNDETKKFMDVLETFGLTQHVTVPTHQSGHILDLIITRSSNDIIINEIRPTLFLSDHCFIECNLAIPCPFPEKKEIQFRKMKHINIEAFKSDIALSKLGSITGGTVEDLVKCYDETLTDILNRHAPLQRKVIRMRAKRPWFSHELQCLKIKRRKLERKMRNSGCIWDKKSYQSICNEYSAKLNNAKRLYYSDLIEKCAGDSRKLFRVVSSLAEVKDENYWPPHSDPEQLVNKFGEFFVRKIELIRAEVDDTVIQPPSVEYRLPLVNFEAFHQLSEIEIRDMVIKSSNVSCELDPIPTWLLKLCADELSPIITKMVNFSLEQGFVPIPWKNSLIRPLLKKIGLEAQWESFRPVNNLQFVSKIAERAVTDQLMSHCEKYAPLPVNQSAYRKFHSTETALVKVQSDILTSMDQQQVTLLILLDLSAAFETVDHEIMLEILELEFGVTGSALKWFKSFLADRKQVVCINQVMSGSFEIKSGVPQGSCLGPILFLLYTSKLFEIIEKHLPNSHGFADDSQLYLSFRPEGRNCEDDAVKIMEKCIIDVRAWLISRKLRFNDFKTEFLIIGSYQQLRKIEINSVHVGDTVILPVKSIRNLGAWFDERMSMNVHVGKMCSKAFRGLYKIKQMRKFLSTESTKTLVHAFVTSHLDYCNSLLAGLPQYQIQRLQKVLNAAARLTCLTPRIAHITPVLIYLHWLPIKFRVQFKIALLVYKALHGMAPKYIIDLLSIKDKSSYNLRSDDCLLLQIPKTNTKTFGDRAFKCAAPSIWNALPPVIRRSETLDCFKRQLKTFLFTKAFNIAA